MSYILHIWEHPSTRPWPATTEEADQFITIARNIRTGGNPKYVAFASALTLVYPDLSSLEETEDGFSNFVWTDSPINGRTEDSIYVIGVVSEHLDNELLNFVAHAACDQGLHMFDMQAGMLYRPDRTTINSKGEARVLGMFGAHRLPGPLSDVETIVKQMISSCSIEGAAKELIHCLAPYHAASDFMPHVPNTVQLELKKQTKELLGSVDDFEIWYFPKYSPAEVAGLTEEGINQKRREDVRRKKQRLLDGMIAVRKCLENLRE